MSPVTPSPVPDQPLQPPRENIPSPITLALGTGIMLQALNSSMIAVAMVSIASHFGAGAEVSWVLSAFYIATAIVSPMARPIPSTIPAMTPDFAAGMMTRKILLSFVAPSASDPS